MQKSGCGYSIDFIVGIAVFIFDTYAHVFIFVELKHVYSIIVLFISME